ncbi:DNA internalization-related competence protein ComEC/Rec2 [Siminovitchia sediminis]|uniref:DNA internalization-related competence protein ComEC/Rec2 n=1 Tax=Siminovitchia sediminis TaxID=1274353 RepID=A0ABW4KCD7_9BACI
MSGKWVYVALAALLGILTAFEPGFLTILFLLLIIIRVKYIKNQNYFFFFCTTVLIFFLLSEFTKARHHSSYATSGKIQEPVTLLESPQFDGNRIKAVAITPAKEKVLLQYLMSAENEKNDLFQKLRSGMTCHVDGILTRPEPNRNEHAFNYALYLERKNIHWILEADRIAADSCYAHRNSVTAVLQNMRATGIQIIENKFPERLSAYTAALVFGDRSLMSEESERAYQRLGIVHLLAISGLHVGIIAGAVYFLCIKMGLTREFAFWLLIVFLPMYAVLTGGNPPVIRAVIMTTLLLLSKRWRLPLSAVDVISISFIAFLMVNPMLVYHVGFQLSYAVSFSLLMSSFLLDHHRSALRKMIHISVVSALSSAPILAYHFYEFSLLSLAANLLYVPFYTLILLPAALVLFILSFTEIPAFNSLVYLLDQMVSLSENIANAASTVPFAVHVTGKPSACGMIFICGGTFLYFLLREKNVQPFKAILPLIFILFFYSVFLKYSPYGEVVFIDVGQGDSILIKLPYNRGTYLIDTGGQLTFPREEWEERTAPYQVGRDTLIPLLKSKGIHRIDKLILTHSDIDHIGAANDVLKELRVGEIWISPNSWEKPVMANLLHVAWEQKIKVKEVQAGENWKNKSGTFQFVFPFDTYYEGNNDSLVLYASMGGLTWLFTGDVEEAGEIEMISAYKHLDIDVLKVAHHGSRGSTSKMFVEYIQPQYAVISAGKSNRYGHPHPEVIDILETEKVHIFRTDKNGGVHYRFTSKKGTFHTVIPYDNAR